MINALAFQTDPKFAVSRRKFLDHRNSKKIKEKTENYWARFDQDDMKLIDKKNTDEARLAAIVVEEPENTDSDNEND